MSKMKPYPLPVEIPNSDDFYVLVTFDSVADFDAKYIVYFVGHYDLCVDCIEDLERA